MNWRRTVLFGLVALALTGTLWADAPAEIEGRLRKDLQFLTSDDCEGRGITTKGINVAADYIAREFEKAGLRPGGADRSFFQPFTLTAGGKLGANNQVVLSGPQSQKITLQRDKHYGVNLLGGTGKVDAPLVFVGYGITSTKPAYDDYASLNVAGKIVVVLTGAPRDSMFDGEFGSPNRGTTPATSTPAKLANALKRKAAAVILVNNQSQGRFGDRVSSRTFLSLRDQPVAIPVLQAQREWLDRMLVSTTGSTLETVEKDINADLKPRSTPLKGWQAQVQTEVTHTLLSVKNVIGVLEGSGPHANETVLVGAHYDHVGYGSARTFAGAGLAGPSAPGGVGFPMSEYGGSSIHFGADDNASGTSAVLELARHFGSMKSRQGRRLVFMAFTAEESGLIGSAYYAQNPLFPLENTVAMLNMDMVGRLQDDILEVTGLGTSKGFPGMVDQANSRFKFNLIRTDAGDGPSDHTSFFRVGVPVMSFFTGFHEQYHRPTDRFETINIRGLGRVTGFVGDLMDQLRTTPERPQFIRATGTFDRTKSLWAMAPAVGILPNYADNKAGMVIDAVVNKTPAAQAGLKKGDRILTAAGKPVKDSTAFLDMSRAWKAGEKIELGVVRAGKEEKIPLQLAKVPTSGGFRPVFQGIVLDTEALPVLKVQSVETNSPAAKAGLKAGDRIDGVNTATGDFRALLTELRNARAGTKVDLTVVRDGKKVQLKLEPTETPRPR